MKTKKIPQRTCTGCKEVKNKNELIRVVKSDVAFSLDFAGKKPGRGAYVCNNINCLELSCKKRGLERSFKAKVPAEIYTQLKAEFENELKNAKP